LKAGQPTEKQLQFLRALLDRSDGKDVWVNTQDPDQCEELGWVEVSPLGGWVLTESGKKLFDKK
jgi:hypothetical protein